MSHGSQQSTGTVPTHDTGSRPVVDFEQLITDHLAAQEDDDSHTELDPSVFHPSSVGYDKWLIFVKKLGLSDTSDLYGTFHTGQMIHEFVQGILQERASDRYGIEKPVQFSEDGLTFTGHADIHDRVSGTLYDIKSRSNWYHFDPPVDRHIDQLHCYMRGLDVEHGQVVYISKSDMEVRTWPDGAPFTFDEERWATIKARVRDVRDAILDHGFPRSESEIPFERPDNYFANTTDLDFSRFASTDE